ncbi:MAG: serine/threonine-protein kinase [Prochlorothrix sp.]
MTPKFPSRRILRSKYRVLGLVGQGQFGKVYCAAHRKTGRLFALKALDHRRFPTHQFLRELRFLLSLRHPNIAGCQALEHTATGRYLVMDYCEGGTLRSLMEGEHPLSLGQSLQLTREILMGLDHAHQRGVIHCDIKPENILLRLKASGWICQITDFGIARLSQENRAGSGSTGSPAYMAPERFYGQYHANADLYAVGVILYEFLVGSRPFSGTPMELMTAHLNRSLTIPETVPLPLQGVIEKALQKLPARRFQSAQEMLVALDEAAQQIQALIAAHPTWFLPSPALPDYRPWQQTWRRSLPTPVYHLATTTNLPRIIAPVPLSPPDFSARPFWDHPLGEIPHPILDPTAGPSASPAQPILALYKGGGKRLNCTVHPNGDFCTENPAFFRHKVLEEIQELVSTPLGCWVLLSTRIELWQLQAQPSPKQQALGLAPQPRCLGGVYQGDNATAKFTVAPNGHWFAVTTPIPKAPSRTVLEIGRLPARFYPATMATPSPTAIFPIAIDDRGRSPATEAGNESDILEDLRAVFGDRPARRLLVQAPQVSQVLIFDITHGLVVGQHQGKSVLELFNRRGQWFGQLDLGVTIDRCVLTPKPYRLLAREPQHDRSLLLLDLKPFRMQRIPLSITPDFFLATTWGFCVANRQGEILILDQDYNTVGRLQIPGTDSDTPLTLTAMTRLDDTNLAIATWSSTEGYLYGVDLRELNLDMVF